MTRHPRLRIPAILVGLTFVASCSAWDEADQSAPPVDLFLHLLEDDTARVKAALKAIEKKWHPGNRAMLVETLRLVRHPGTSNRITALLGRQTGQQHNRDQGGWFHSIWQEPYTPHPRYAEFKARLYSRIDPPFAEYFTQDAPATIRLDEIRWGGVVRDGIPPLKDPETLTAEEATYLADSDVVFGVTVNGEARAYPKRILAWHEMVKDVVGGVSINGVYCTLCGSMIVYRTKTADGTHYELGTSGFLYRSNKLMYDHDTKSLWSTVLGAPVVGELTGKGIVLQPHHVVTTTWGQWKSDHPETRVLSPYTGHRRDYREGVAYRHYFATDELMFAVPELDTRLKNKDEVFIVRAQQQDAEPLAIALDLLRRERVYHETIGNLRFVVVTDETGANRAYDAGDLTFEATDDDGIRDGAGSTWTITDESLLRSDGGDSRPRLPAHRAFWFGWHAAHPDTRLAK